MSGRHFFAALASRTVRTPARVWLATLAASATVTLAARPAEAQFGTRDVVVCGGISTSFPGARLACMELVLTATVAPGTGGAGTLQMAVRNFSGDNTYDAPRWSMLSDFGWYTTADLSGGGTLAYPSLYSITPGTAGPVGVTGPTPWDAVVGTGEFFATSYAKNTFYDPRQNRYIPETRGIAGCYPFTYFTVDSHQNRTEAFVPAFSTCRLDGLTGTVTFGSFDVQQVISPNYFDKMSFYAMALPPSGYLTPIACYMDLTTGKGSSNIPNQPCDVISDTYTGSTFGFPLTTPEPATWALVGTGLLALGVTYRRRQRA